MGDDLIRLGVARKISLFQKTYHAEPPGEVDIERAFIENNAKCYVRYELGDDELKFRTLVITDISLARETLEELAKVSRMLKSFIKEHDAKIYIWTGDLIPFTNDSSALSLAEVRIASITQIQQAFLRKQISIMKDDLAIVDHLLMKKLKVRDYCIHTAYLPEYNIDYDDNTISSNIIFSLTQNDQQVFFDYYRENNKTLHLILDYIDYENIDKMVAQLNELPSIQCYLYKISAKQFESWSRILNGIDEDRIVGFHHQHNNIEKSCKLVEEYLSNREFTNLKYLSLFFREIDSEDHVVYKIINRNRDTLEYLGLDYVETLSILETNIIKRLLNTSFKCLNTLQLQNQICLIEYMVEFINKNKITNLYTFDVEFMSDDEEVYSLSNITYRTNRDEFINFDVKDCRIEKDVLPKYAIHNDDILERLGTEYKNNYSLICNDEISAYLTEEINIIMKEINREGFSIDNTENDFLKSNNFEHFLPKNDPLSEFNIENVFVEYFSYLIHLILNKVIEYQYLNKNQFASNEQISKYIDECISASKVNIFLDQINALSLKLPSIWLMPIALHLASKFPKLHTLKIDTGKEHIDDTSVYERILESEYRFKLSTVKQLLLGYTSDALNTPKSKCDKFIVDCIVKFNCVESISLNDMRQEYWWKLKELKNLKSIHVNLLESSSGSIEIISRILPNILLNIDYDCYKELIDDREESEDELNENEVMLKNDTSTACNPHGNFLKAEIYFKSSISDPLPNYYRLNVLKNEAYKLSNSIYDQPDSQLYLRENIDEVCERATIKNTFEYTRDRLGFRQGWVFEWIANRLLNREYENIDSLGFESISEDRYSQEMSPPIMMESGGCQYSYEIDPSKMVPMVINYVDTKFLLEHKFEIKKSTNNISIIHIENKFEGNVKNIHSTFFPQDNHFYASINLDLNPNKWLPLPSISTNDELCHIDSSEPIIVGYSVDTALYYVMPVEDAKSRVKIEYIVKSELIIHKAEDWHPHVNQYYYLIYSLSLSNGVIKRISYLPPKLLYNRELLLRVVCGYLATFQSGKLEIHNNATDDEIDNALIKSRIGACRHRAKLAFKLLNSLGFDVRYIESDIHAFIEVKEDGKYICIDLGGYPTNVIENDNVLSSPSPEPKYKKKFNPFKKTIQNLSFETDDEYSAWFESKIFVTDSNRKQILFVVESMAFAENAFQTLKCQLSSSGVGQALMIDNLHQLKLFETEIIDNAVYYHPNHIGDFIDQANSDDVLWINIDKYQPSIINPLFDHRRQLRNKIIPNDTLMVAAISQDLFQDMGDDFLSRFREIYKLSSIPRSAVVHDHTSDSTPYIINMLDPFKAESQLKGSYQFQATNTSFQIGELQRAIESGFTHIELINAPIDDPSFALFVDNLLRDRFYYSNGKRIDLPVGFKISNVVKPYEFLDCYEILDSNEIHELDYVLNTQTLTEFITGIPYSENNQYAKQASFLSSFAGNKITVLLTQSFPDYVWANILTIAAEHHCHLNILLGKNVHLPREMASMDGSRCHSISSRNIISCSDIGYAKSVLEDEYDYAVFVTKDTTFEDLFGKLMISSFEKRLVSFVETDIGLKIQSGKSLLLLGEFSSELYSKLQTLYTKNPYIIINGNMFNVGDKLKILIQKSNSHIYTNNEIPVSLELLFESINSSHEIQNNNIFPFINYLQNNGILNFNYEMIANVVKHSNLFPYTNPIMELFSIDLSDEHRDMVQAYWKQHVAETITIDNIDDYAFEMLRNNSIVCLTGAPQTGKKFLARKLCAQFIRYNDINTIDDWLSNGGVLVLDHFLHANNTELMLVDAFRHNPDSILWCGKYYKTGNQHRILIIVANEKPAQRFQTLFRSGVPTIECKPFTDDFIVQNIILPDMNSQECFENENRQALALWFLAEIKTIDPSCTLVKIQQILHFAIIHHSLIAELIKDIYKVPLLDRTMCKLIMKTTIAINYDTYESGLDDVVSLIKHNYLFSTLHRDAVVSIDYENNVPSNFYPSSNKMESFRLLPNQKPMAFHLIALLSQIEKRNPDEQNRSPRGLILEGPPGVGKTFLLEKILKKLGYLPLTESDMDVDDNAKHYVIAPSEDLILCKSRIKFAYENNCVVIVDEFNTLANEMVGRSEQTFESLLLHLFDRADTDAEKNRFRILANQNAAIGFTGRRLFSDTLLQRFSIIQTPYFQLEDFVAIAESERCKNPEKIAKQFMSAVKKYDKDKSISKPTIRSFIDEVHVAKKLESMKRKAPMDYSEPLVADTEMSLSKKKKSNE